jgi:two-component system, NtrC family, nitrogen regulation sensor histidine kinase NtrY
MSGPWWFAAGLVAGLLLLWVSRARTAHRARLLTRAIEALGRDPGHVADVGAELAPVLRAAHGIAEMLHRHEGAARERESLLRAALDAAPSAIVLFSDLGRISLANQAARDLFFEGRDQQGEDFLTMLGRAPDALRRAISNQGDELFSVDDSNGERQTYHLAKRRFVAAGEPVVLVLVKNLSRELHRQEADAWKRMIRIFSHELNNSLAPISSLVHSARIVVADAPVAPRLERIFSTIAERADHLRTFLDAYARFARLPLPRQEPVEWRPFVERLLALWPAVRLEGELPSEPGWFDPAQLEQVAINLLKNAEESGGPVEEISLSVTSLGQRGVRLTIADRGTGMSHDVLQSALVPFYSTKERGSGLGLPLCREIVEAHGGSLRLESREGGGTSALVRLPGHASADEAQGKLTLTRS